MYTCCCSENISFNILQIPLFKVKCYIILISIGNNTLSLNMPLQFNEAWRYMSELVIVRPSAIVQRECSRYTRTVVVGSTTSADVILTWVPCSACHSSCWVWTCVHPSAEQPRQGPSAWTLRSFLPTWCSLRWTSQIAAPAGTATAGFVPSLKQTQLWSLSMDA